MATAYTERDGRSWRCDGCGSHGRIPSATDGHRVAAETAVAHIEECTPPSDAELPDRCCGCVGAHCCTHGEAPCCTS